MSWMRRTSHRSASGTYTYADKIVHLASDVASRTAGVVEAVGIGVAATQVGLAFTNPIASTAAPCVVGNCSSGGVAMSVLPGGRLASAQNQKLRNIIDALYRRRARIGSGSTADANRHELKNRAALESERPLPERGRNEERSSAAVSQSIAERSRQDDRKRTFAGPSECAVWPLESHWEEQMLVPQPLDPVKLLLKRVPEMKAFIDVRDLASPYVVFAMPIGASKARLIDDDVTKRTFDVLNELAETGTPELENLVQAGALELVADDDRLRQLAKKHLRPKAMRLLRDAEAS
jgi:hypothetical protein